MNNRTIKPVSFNEDTEKEMLDFIKDKKFATYVKGLIQKDIDYKKNGSVFNIDEMLRGILAGNIITNISKPSIAPIEEPVVESPVADHNIPINKLSGFKRGKKTKSVE